MDLLLNVIAISTQCRNLVRLEVSYADMDTATAIAIVNMLPNI